MNENRKYQQKLLEIAARQYIETNIFNLCLEEYHKSCGHKFYDFGDDNIGGAYVLNFSALELDEDNEHLYPDGGFYANIAYPDDMYLDEWPRKNLMHYDGNTDTWVQYETVEGRGLGLAFRCETANGLRKKVIDQQHNKWRGKLVELAYKGNNRAISYTIKGDQPWEV